MTGCLGEGPTVPLTEKLRRRSLCLRSIPLRGYRGARLFLQYEHYVLYVKNKTFISSSPQHDDRGSDCADSRGGPGAVVQINSLAFWPQRVFHWFPSHLPA